MMESETSFTKEVRSVKDLQAALFPVSPRGSGFLANFLLKSGYTDEDEDRLPKIKESQTLFVLNRDEPFIPQPPRWPTECQVLNGRVEHIYYTPSTPEPYYIPTGIEPQPKPIGEECGIIIYQYYPISAVNYFSRSSVGGSKYLLPTCPCPEDDSLLFESRFESGNLAKVIRITENYYELYLRTDLYTSKHIQWFYFRVSNMKKNFLYRFSIVNLCKDTSLYNEGMRPLMYSTKDSQMHSIGWRRCGSNITYYSNENGSVDDPDQCGTYTLTFTTEFPHDKDDVYFAHSCPYTYSDLQDYLMELANHPIKATYSTLRILCRTLAGNNVYYVTVTSPPVTGETRKKPAIVITARVHPGETPASWMMKGFLDFLTSDTGPAKELRDNFIFKLVPMLNPDGVIVGNNRCSLTGRDLNRQYRTVIRESYPSIWYTKLMIRRLLEETGVAMYCDLHAHSRKHNIFIYGCENRRGEERRLFEQVFPLMLHKNAADKFSFENCHFRVQKNKEGTGRVVMWMMGISNSYTMEATFGGSVLGSRSDSHFSVQDYEQMGRTFCQTLLDFYDDDPRKERLRIKIINRLLMEGSNAEVPTNIKLSDYSRCDDGDTSSSSSEEDDDSRDRYEEIKLIVPPPSPAIAIRKKTKAHPKKKTQQSKLPQIPRKPLLLNSTAVELSLSRKFSVYISETSMGSESESETEFSKERIKRVHPKKKKKKHKKKKHKDYNNESDNPNRKNNLTVVDLLPDGKMRAHSWHRSLVVSQQKTLSESSNRPITTQQLLEVQAKLTNLKNRLWLGVGGDFNTPLPWKTTDFTFSAPQSAPPDNQFKTKVSRKKSSKPEKSDKKGAKKAKQPAEPRDKSQQKPQNGLRRQTKLDLTVLEPIALRIKKARSLPEATIHRGKAKASGALSCEEDATPAKTAAKKEKKKKKKFAKKAKAVTNANLFIR